jgi:hypothetical protein
MNATHTRIAKTTCINILLSLSIILAVKIQPPENKFAMPSAAVYRKVGKEIPSYCSICLQKNELDPLVYSSNRCINKQNSSIQAQGQINGAGVQIHPAFAVFEGTRKINFQDGESASPLVTRSDVDEQLFLLYLLEKLHSAWPTQTEGNDLLRGIHNHRLQLSKYETYASIKLFDPLLIEMYKDTSNLLNQYSTALEELDIIQKDQLSGKTQAQSDGLAGAATEGFGVGAATAMFEPTTAFIVLSGWAIKKVFDENQRISQIDERAQQRSNRVLNSYLSERSRVLGTTRAKATLLAQKRGWQLKELGFQEDPNEEALMIRASESSDYVYFRQRIQELKELRARDPFTFEESGDLSIQIGELYQLQDDVETLRNISRAAVYDYIQAAQLVPSANIFDDYRADLLTKAADSANNLVCYSGEKDELGIKLANAALSYRPKDSTGLIRMIKAYALARNGQVKKALDLLDEISSFIRDDATYNYHRACFFCIDGNVSAAFDAFMKAWQLGYRDVVEIKEDRDLALLFKAKSRELNKLFSPSVSGQIDYGYVWNDIKVTNESGFDLTDLFLRARWQGQKGGYYEVYFLPLLRSGETTLLQGVLDAATKSEEKFFLFTKRSSEQSRSFVDLEPNEVTGSFNGISTLNKLDGSNVQQTVNAKLSVSMNADKTLRFNYSGHGQGINVPSGGLHNNRMVWESDNGAQHLLVIFDADCVYGLASNSEDEDVQAFWFDR